MVVLFRWWDCGWFALLISDKEHKLYNRETKKKKKPLKSKAVFDFAIVYLTL